MEKRRPQMTMRQRIFLALAAYIPSLGLYFFPTGLFPQRATHNMSIGWDAWLPFVPQAIVVYALVPAVLLLPFLLILHRRTLFRFTVGILALALVVFLSSLFFPVHMPRPGIPTQENFSFWSVALLYTVDSPTRGFPSLLAALVVLSLSAVASLTRRLSYIATLTAFIIILSALVLSQQSLLAALTGSLLGLGVYFLWIRFAMRDYNGSTDKTDANLIQKSLGLALGLSAVIILFAFLLFSVGLRFSVLLPV